MILTNLINIMFSISGHFTNNVHENLRKNKSRFKITTTSQ